MMIGLSSFEWWNLRTTGLLHNHKKSHTTVSETVITAILLHYNALCPYPRAFHGTRPMKSHPWKYHSLVLLLSRVDTYRIYSAWFLRYDVASLLQGFPINRRCVTWHCAWKPMVSRHVSVAITFCSLKTVGN